VISLTTLAKSREYALLALIRKQWGLTVREPQFPERVNFRNMAGIAHIDGGLQFGTFCLESSFLTIQHAQRSLHHFAGIRIASALNHGQDEIIQIGSQIDISVWHTTLLGKNPTVFFWNTAGQLGTGFEFFWGELCRDIVPSFCTYWGNLAVRLLAILTNAQHIPIAVHNIYRKQAVFSFSFLGSHSASLLWLQAGA
jgi:hypothetical protein